MAITPHLSKIIAGELGHSREQAERTRDWLINKGFDAPDVAETWTITQPSRGFGNAVAKVGTELQLIFDELQQQFPIPIPKECTCAALRAEMDALGIAGCQTQRNRLIEGVRNNVRIAEFPSEELRGLVLEAIPTLFEEALKRASSKLNTRSVTPQKPKSSRKRRVRVLGGKPKGCCNGSSVKVVGKRMIWSYGVTTVPSRRDTLLPQTLASLAAAGFDKPRLFVDGCDETQDWKRRFGVDVTTRYPKVGVAVNWILALCELVQREPNADRFAVFQDDCVTYRNLRQYLERTPYPDKSYLNLITQLENEPRARDKSGWFEAVQLGRGAVALVFSREAAAVLLSERGFVERSQDRKRGQQAIDGGVLYAMQKQGWKEYCHAPSLVQHIGKVSTIGHNIPQTKLFRGEDYDALDLLK